MTSYQEQTIPCCEAEISAICHGTCAISDNIYNKDN